MADPLDLQRAVLSVIVGAIVLIISVAGYVLISSHKESRLVEDMLKQKERMLKIEVRRASQRTMDAWQGHEGRLELAMGSNSRIAALEHSKATSVQCSCKQQCMCMNGSAVRKQQREDGGTCSKCIHLQSRCMRCPQKGTESRSSHLGWTTVGHARAGSPAGIMAGKACRHVRHGQLAEGVNGCSGHGCTVSRRAVRCE